MLLKRIDDAAVLAGKSTPVFFGSAVNNFGVQPLLDFFVEHAPSPQARATTTRPSVTTPVTAGPEVVSAPLAPRDTGSGAAVGQGDGSGIGTGDPNVRGVRPGYFDGRVWRDPVVVGNAGGGGGGDRSGRGAAVG